MKPRHLLVVLLALAACDDSTPDYFQGYVEADTLFVGAEDGGRLTSLAVEEGAAVAAGQALFTLDQQVERAARNRAAAELAAAEAELARLEAETERPEEIAVLQADLAAAEAALDLSTAELERIEALVARGNASRADYDEAQSQFDQDRARLEQIRRQITVAKLPAHPFDIDAAKGRVAAAAAALASAEATLARRQVASPAAGLVQAVYFRAGEVADAGQPVVAILPPENLKLRFFVPQALLPALAPGATVSVTCDGCGTPLAATVTFLSDEAEYTPPVIYSLEERQKLVFLVEAKPDEPARLRVGQPVEVRLP
ncbi:MAG TPA: HlyD family efflux transporter periplasmic adaptor subunit [Kiloniellales bacterium]|nr:HlyD family efflux transporter periplasmic adaptor subunit [Kiloniellales bacterium]